MIRRWLPLLLAGCLKPEGGLPADAGPPDAPAAGSIAVTITAPAPGTSVRRDQLLTNGRWAARATFTARLSSPASQVDWMSNGLVVGVGLPPDYAYTGTFLTDGAQNLAAVVHGDSGAELGRAPIALTVASAGAETADCKTKLGLLGIDYTEGPETMGIMNPVTLKLPLRGISITKSDSIVPRNVLLMDCDIALSLWRMVDVLAENHVTGIFDSGLYNYRCVSASEEPPCEASGFSLHANGLAFDLAGVTLDTGERISVKNDWVVEPLASGQSTCSLVPTGSMANRRLHQILCDLAGYAIFKVLLTPNYNPMQTFLHFDLAPDMMLVQ